MLNLYAYRATIPADMWKAQKRGIDILGGQRNWVKALKGYIDAFSCDLVVASWGAHGKKRGPDVCTHWGVGLTCLGRNNDGSPKHPLYLKGDSWPVPYA
jgi:hypothetical protein